VTENEIDFWWRYDHFFRMARRIHWPAQKRHRIAARLAEIRERTRLDAVDLYFAVAS